MKILKNHIQAFVFLFLFIFFSGLCCQAQKKNEHRGILLIEDFSAFDTSRLSFLDSKASVVDYRDEKALQITLGHNKPWPKVAIAVKRDLSKYNYLEADISNKGKEQIRVSCRVDNPNATGKANQSGGGVTVDPGEMRTLRVTFNRQSPNNFKKVLKGMHFYPDGTSHKPVLNSSNVVSIQFFGHRPSSDQTFNVDNIRATGIFDKNAFESSVPKNFMPFIDSLGQYKHINWPGKTHSIEDLQKQKEKEIKDLNKYSGSAGRDHFGGWTSGPQLKATGHFRVEKYKEKWWLIDPVGRLFWSFGITCVGTGGVATFVEKRDEWFEKLPPEKGDPFSEFYFKAGSKHGDFKGQKLSAYDFGAAERQSVSRNA